jgi:hypothetical protein
VKFAPHPYRTPIVGVVGKLVDHVWSDWFRAVADAITSTAQKIAFVEKTSQTAAIASTDIPAPTLTAGLYKISWYARITTAAGVSSSLTPSFTYVDGGVSCTVSGAAMTGNTTATVQSGTALIRNDNGTAIQYATAYASNPANAMAYRLDVRLERVP